MSGNDDAEEEPRPISWIKAAEKAFGKFPQQVRTDILTALMIAAAGDKADSAKPMKGLGAGVMEIALRHNKDAYRAVYALKLDNDIWVIHAFQKKSKTGIKTPQSEIDLIKERIKRLKEKLKDEQETKH